MAGSDEFGYGRTSASRLVFVILFFVLVSWTFERFLWWLQRRIEASGMKSLVHAMERVRDEMMVTCFGSLLLLAIEGDVLTLCMPTVTHGRTCDSSWAAQSAGVDAPVAVSAPGPTGAPACPEGEGPFVSPSAMHQAHIGIFLLMLTHILYTSGTVVHAIEGSRHLQQLEPTNSDRRVTAHTLSDYASSSYGRWARALCEQFTRAVDEFTFVTLRRMFVLRWGLHPSFNFHRYVMQCMHEDLADLMGVNWWMWVCVLLSVLGDGYVLGGLLQPLAVLVCLYLGAKLRYVASELSYKSVRMLYELQAEIEEVEGRRGGYTDGTLSASDAEDLDGGGGGGSGSGLASGGTGTAGGQGGGVSPRATGRNAHAGADTDRAGAAAAAAAGAGPGTGLAASTTEGDGATAVTPRSLSRGGATASAGVTAGSPGNVLKGSAATGTGNPATAAGSRVGAGVGPRRSFIGAPQVERLRADSVSSFRSLQLPRGDDDTDSITSGGPLGHDLLAPPWASDPAVRASQLGLQDGRRSEAGSPALSAAGSVAHAAAGATPSAPPLHAQLDTPGRTGTPGAASARGPGVPEVHQTQAASKFDSPPAGAAVTAAAGHAPSTPVAATPGAARANGPGNGAGAATVMNVTVASGGSIPRPMSGALARVAPINTSPATDALDGGDPVGGGGGGGGSRLLSSLSPTAAMQSLRDKLSTGVAVASASASRTSSPASRRRTRPRGLQLASGELATDSKASAGASPVGTALAPGGAVGGGGGSALGSPASARSFFATPGPGGPSVPGTPGTGTHSSSSRQVLTGRHTRGAAAMPGGNGSGNGNSSGNGSSPAGRSRAADWERHKRAARRQRGRGSKLRRTHSGNDATRGSTLHKVSSTQLPPVFSQNFHVDDHRELRALKELSQQALTKGLFGAVGVDALRMLMRFVMFENAMEVAFAVFYGWQVSCYYDANHVWYAVARVAVALVTSVFLSRVLIPLWSLVVHMGENLLASHLLPPEIKAAVLQRAERAAAAHATKGGAGRELAGRRGSMANLLSAMNLGSLGSLGNMSLARKPSRASAGDTLTGDGALTETVTVANQEVTVVDSIDGHLDDRDRPATGRAPSSYSFDAGGRYGGDRGAVPASPQRPNGALTDRDLQLDDEIEGAPTASASAHMSHMAGSASAMPLLSLGGARSGSASPEHARTSGRGDSDAATAGASQADAGHPRSRPRASLQRQVLDSRGLGDGPDGDMRADIELGLGPGRDRRVSSATSFSADSSGAGADAGALQAVAARGPLPRHASDASTTADTVTGSPVPDDSDAASEQGLEMDSVGGGVHLSHLGDAHGADRPHSDVARIAVPLSSRGGSSGGGSVASGVRLRPLDSTYSATGMSAGGSTPTPLFPGALPRRGTRDGGAAPRAADADRGAATPARSAEGWLETAGVGLGEGASDGGSVGTGSLSLHRGPSEGARSEPALGSSAPAEERASTDAGPRPQVGVHIGDTSGAAAGAQGVRAQLHHQQAQARALGHHPGLPRRHVMRRTSAPHRPSPLSAMPHGYVMRDDAAGAGLQPLSPAQGPPHAPHGEAGQEAKPSPSADW